MLLILKQFHCCGNRLSCPNRPIELLSRFEILVAENNFERLGRVTGVDESVGTTPPEVEVGAGRTVLRLEVRNSKFYNFGFLSRDAAAARNFASW
jgi:hypothetical protein